MTTAAGRLWRRAPLWRLLIAASLAFGVLAAIYPAPSLHPPAWVKLPPWLHLPRAAPPPAPGAPPPQPAGTTIGTGVPTQPTVHGTLTLAGRIVPLPAGEWHELMAARAEDASERNELVLGRWTGAALTGLLAVQATTGPADDGRPAGVIGACDNYGNFAVKWLDAGRTCWLVRRMDLPPAAAAGHTIEDAAIARLRTLGVTVPPSFATAVWSHAEGSELMIYDLQLADIRNPSSPTARLAALQTWMTRFAPLLRRGFDGDLDAGAVAPVARDPGLVTGSR